MLCKETLGHDALGMLFLVWEALALARLKGRGGGAGKQWCQKHVNGTEDPRQHRAAQKPSRQAGEDAKGYCTWG